MSVTREKSRHSKDSAVETRYLIMPKDANPYGSAFGGLIMSVIDETAYMAASRHAGTSVVTAAIDSLSFVSPVRVGDQIVLNARVTYTGTKSMEVSVTVMKDNPDTGERRLATTAYLTFVALDEHGKPKEIPPLLLTTDDDRASFERARLRVASRKEHRCRYDEFTEC